MAVANNVNNTTISSILNTTTISYQDVTGYVVTGVVCGVLLVLFLSILIAVIIHYRLIRKSPKHTVDMGQQCMKYKKPAKTMINKNSDRNSNSECNHDNLNKIKCMNGSTSYLQTSKDFIPKDLVTAVNNPNYTASPLNMDDLPPYSYTNPIYEQSCFKLNRNKPETANDTHTEYQNSRRYSETTSL